MQNKAYLAASIEATFFSFGLIRKHPVVSPPHILFGLAEGLVTNANAAIYFKQNCVLFSKEYRNKYVSLQMTLTAHQLLRSFAVTHISDSDLKCNGPI